MLIYRGFSGAKAIAGTNAFIFSINATSSGSMHTVFLPTPNRLVKPDTKANRRIGLRSIIGVGQALPLDCFKVKGMTVTEGRLQACVIAKHRSISLQATSVGLEQHNLATTTRRLG